MPKCHAPHAASHRGNPIEIAPDGSCELSEEALSELRAHGFHAWIEGGAAKPLAGGEAKSAAPTNEQPRAARAAPKRHGAR